MLETQKGLFVTTGSNQAIDAINHFHHQILGFGKQAGDILTAASDHPDNLLIQTYAAIFYLYAQENEATVTAADYLMQAEKQLHNANRREQLLYHAAVAWQRRDFECAIALFAAVTDLFPRDTLALKFAEWLFYCQGQAYKGHQYLALCEQCAGENQDESHFLAMHSFALELSGHYDKANDMAEQAISMNRLTPWAHHTLAHVYLLKNDITGGIKRLQTLQGSWNDILPLLKGHNTWHLALFHLAWRDNAAVSYLFPEIFGTMPDTVSEQIDAISLLWRMDMAGLPQDTLFQSLLPHLKQHPFEHYTGFNSAHFIYCLVRNGEMKLADTSLKTIEAHARSQPKGCGQNLWRNLVFPSCKGIYYFAQQDYKTAQETLAPVIENYLQMGGSDAQDELFTQTYLLSLLRTNQKDKAYQFFNRYLKHYQNTPLAENWFS
ncbi:tetratricopeptide repeat protein [Legionella spiritensis]|uniref:Tetratricopeptide repeat protein 38 n=1 Tax=Legionella spiritensis TaxID=452 RepID=A0A0W0YXW8_LEGSP|nr:hypothetical protein Lspi_2384 [Legionella spiritensis]SNV38595.1 ATP-dependent transcriptional regulator [Legionella spiritensis]